MWTDLGFAHVQQEIKLVQLQNRICSSVIVLEAQNSGLGGGVEQPVKVQNSGLGGGSTVSKTLTVKS